MLTGEGHSRIKGATEFCGVCKRSMDGIYKIKLYSLGQSKQNESVSSFSGQKIYMALHDVHWVHHEQKGKYGDIIWISIANTT